MRFQSPLLLLLLSAVPLVAWLRLKRRRPAAVIFSALGALRGALPAGGIRFERLPLFLRCAAALLIALALARPVKGLGRAKVFAEGIDIVLALDVSSSMASRDMTDDLRVNRLYAAKDVVKRFIPERGNDRLGIVAFARYAYTISPLTLDHDLLIDTVDRLKIVPRGGDEDGTAIGSAIVTSLGRLKDSAATSRVIILLTDGANNFGQVSPEAAAGIARSLKVKIYTIGAGTEGEAPYPVTDDFGCLRFVRASFPIDEKTLRAVAGATGGEYFRAQDERALREIYRRINAMEKTRIEEEKFTEHRELFPLLLIPALALLFAEAVAGATLLRRIP